MHGEMLQMLGSFVVPNIILMLIDPEYITAKCKICDS